jgi:uncharacterized protein YnzC (UPF0291/DUF896 family)
MQNVCMQIHAYMKKIPQINFLKTSSNAITKTYSKFRNLSLLKLNLLNFRYDMKATLNFITIIDKKMLIPLFILIFIQTPGIRHF